MTETLLTKSFLEYTADDLKTGLDEGVHHLKVTEAVQDYWDEEGERARLNIQTEVVSGKSAGKFGPRHSFSIGEASGTTANGREWEITGEDSAKRLFKQVVKGIHDGKELVLSNPMVVNATMLSEMAAQIVGDEFLAMVKEDKNGYDRIMQFHSLINPPKRIKVPADAVVADFVV
tara:strand:- start:649 stop:1173 length:525 start_codon:yes stop_codon:yes gene_type:complete